MHTRNSATKLYTKTNSNMFGDMNSFSIRGNDNDKF